MYYALSIVNGYIVGIVSSEQEFKNNLTEAEKNEIHHLLLNRPNAEEGYQYMLKADTMVWELVELPKPSDDDELDVAEALSIITGEAE